MPIDQPLPTWRAARGLYAGFWRRVLAWCIDTLIVVAVHLVLTVAFGTWLLLPWTMAGGAHGDAVARLVDIGLQPLGVVVLWLYYAVCESSRWQATPGKLALGLRVTDECGRRIGFARATGRCFGMLASALTLCIGFLFAGWTVRKQALHDLLARCCVVRGAGLAAWSRADLAGVEGAATPTGPVGRPDMPGWAIVLVVIAGGLFVFLPALVIVGVVAVPVYRSHVARGQIEQGLNLTERPRALVAEYIGARGTLPDGNAALGLPKPEAIHASYVTSVRVVGGKVVVTYGNQASPAIRGGHVVVSPYGEASRLRWLCSSPDIGGQYLPERCR